MRASLRSVMPAAFVFIFWGIVASAQLNAEVVSLRIMSWNVESDGADPRVVARRIAAAEGVHIWALSEVGSDSDAEQFEDAAEVGEEGDFKRIVGTTGGRDRLAIIYDSSKLTLHGTEELHRINIAGRVRAPLVAHFEGKKSGQQFLFMVVHLYRGSTSGRHQQATMLNQWARSQTLPVIACGDWNFDWHVQTGDDPSSRDRGFDHLTSDGVFTWVRPNTLVKTQDSDFNSVLDFVFVAGEAAGWQATSTIVVERGDFPNDRRTSDHRPVECVFTLDTNGRGPSLTPEMSNQEILNRISELEEELKQLRRMIESRN